MPPTENTKASSTDPKTATRAQILQAALVCFAGKGYHKTTMDDIAAESSLSKGALYWHFKSKQELFVSLIDWFMTSFSQEAFQAWPEDMSAADKIRAAMGAIVGNNEQLIPFYKIILDFWAQTGEDEQLQQMFETMLEKFQGQLSAIIEEGIARGEFRPTNAPPLALALLALIDSLILYATLLSTKIDTRQALDTVLEVIIAGLKS
jgi:AcrR family transcriptional regulator